MHQDAKKKYKTPLGLHSVINWIVFARQFPLRPVCLLMSISKQTWPRRCYLFPPERSALMKAEMVLVYVSFAPWLATDLFWPIGGGVLSSPVNVWWSHFSQDTKIPSYRTRGSLLSDGKINLFTSFARFMRWKLAFHPSAFWVPAEGWHWFADGRMPMARVLAILLRSSHRKSQLEQPLLITS